MSPLAENDIRDRLRAALDDIQTSPRPLPELRRAVIRRRRERQLALIAAAGVLAVAGITAGLATAGGAGPRDKVVPEKQVDPVPALHRYVKASHGTSLTALVTGADGGTYAADLEAGKVHVLSFDGRVWTSVAQLGSPISGPPIIAVRPGPRGAGDSAAFQVDLPGGDQVYNGIVVDSGTWRYADFDCGKTTVACSGRGHRATRYSTDGTEINGAFHSEPNSCNPNCAAGTRYDVTWRWDPTYAVFVVASSFKMQ